MATGKVDFNEELDHFMEEELSHGGWVTPVYPEASVSGYQLMRVNSCGWGEKGRPSSVASWTRRQWVRWSEIQQDPSVTFLRQGEVRHLAYCHPIACFRPHSSNPAHKDISLTPLYCRRNLEVRLTDCDWLRVNP